MSEALPDAAFAVATQTDFNSPPPHPRIGPEGPPGVQMAVLKTNQSQTLSTYKNEVGHNKDLPRYRSVVIFRACSTDAGPNPQRFHPLLVPEEHRPSPPASPLGQCAPLCQRAVDPQISAPHSSHIYGASRQSAAPSWALDCGLRRRPLPVLINQPCGCSAVFTSRLLLIQRKGSLKISDTQNHQSSGTRFLFVKDRRIRQVIRPEVHRSSRGGLKQPLHCLGYALQPRGSEEREAVRS